MNTYRHPKAVITPINIGLIALRNPNLALWWSAIFPGFPQIAMCRYLTGYILILWEFFINEKSNLNQAILYTFLGKFDLAQQVLDMRWALMYLPVYIFGMWDSRRLVMDINKFAILADSTGSAKDVPPSNVGWYESNFMIKRKPIIAACWSFIMPGLGHLYIHRIPTAIFFIIIDTAVFYHSNFLPALHLTVLGHFNEATSILNAQWLLYYPSIHGFAIFDSYSFCNKGNKLMKAQQTMFFEEQAQPLTIQTHLLSKRGNVLNVVASFAHSIYVELATVELKQNGIKNDDIFVIPLVESKPKKNMDMIRRGEELNLFEGTVAMATFVSTLGVIYGFIWRGGPVLWGMIGFSTGAILGFLIDYLVQKKELIKKRKKGKGGELILIIHCNQEKVQVVKDILFDHFTLGVSVIDLNRDNKTLNSDNSTNDMLG